MKSEKLINEKSFDMKKVDVKLITSFYNNEYDKIDILIADTIRIFNENGIETVACCSGHISYGKESQGYLWIKDNLEVPNYVMKHCCSIEKCNDGYFEGIALRWEVESLDKNKERMKAFEKLASSFKILSTKDKKELKFSL